jgi:spore protease
MQPGGRDPAAAAEIRKLLPEEGTILVAGLGNGDLTPDSLGPQTCKRFLSQGAVRGGQKRFGGKLRPVAAVISGVSGGTGMESSELIAAVARASGPRR